MKRYIFRPIKQTIYYFQKLFSFIPNFLCSCSNLEICKKKNGIYNPIFTLLFNISSVTQQSNLLCVGTSVSGTERHSKRFQAYLLHMLKSKSKVWKKLVSNLWPTWIFAHQGEQNGWNGNHIVFKTILNPTLGFRPPIEKANSDWTNLWSWFEFVVLLCWLILHSDELEKKSSKLRVF